VSRIIRARSIGHGGTYHSIPVYSLVSAGGPFRDNPDVRLLGRIHPPENLKSFNPDYFVVPRRGTLHGTHHPFWKLLLIAILRTRQQVRQDRIGRRAQDSRVCLHVKRYVRRPPPRDESTARGRIFLESIHPDQPDIELEEDAESQDQRYAVIAEYVQVLRPPLDWVKPAFVSFVE
jgi:hypothetical protein